MFYSRVHLEIERVVHGLRAAGVRVKVRTNLVGENGEQLIGMLARADQPQRVGGETLVRIDDRLVPSLLLCIFPFTHNA